LRAARVARSRPAPASIGPRDDIHTGTTNMTDLTTITDRASWLAFRADWRMRYRQASQDVRDVKRDMRALVADWRTGTIGSDALDERMSYRQIDRHAARGVARNMMDELDEAKERRDALLAERDAPAQAA
jgi:hypothetical protein